MAAVTSDFISFDNHGTPLTVTVTYDDVTGKVASFDWDNAGAPTSIEITVGTAPTQTRQVPAGPGSFVPGGGGITMVKNRFGNWMFPLSVSIAAA